MFPLALQTNRIAIEALAEALEARDPYTAGHGVRVAELSVHIGESLGIPQADIQALRLGGRLHDIGKVGIPDFVLLKPSPLTEQESGIMQMHTRIGRRILAGLRGMDELLAAIELHHENFDGSGYPYGLEGDNVPIIARIVRVADAFDAMTTTRVYRPSFNAEQAAEQIRSGAGRQFDPEVVEAFEAVLREAAVLGASALGDTFSVPQLA